MIRFAIASFAHTHPHSYARVLRELEREGIASLKAIYDNSKDRLKTTSEIYKPEKVYEDLYSLAEDKDIDAVIIVSENSKHREHTIPMIRSGKHVLVEKPIATSYRDGYEMVEEARKHGVKL